MRLVVEGFMQTELKHYFLIFQARDTPFKTSWRCQYDSCIFYRSQFDTEAKLTLKSIIHTHTHTQMCMNVYPLLLTKAIYESLLL